MKIVSDREFRNNPGKIRESLSEQDVVLTSRGKPYAVLLPVDENNNVEEILELAAQLRAQRALSSVRQKAAEAGLNEMSTSEIDEEIENVRKKRQR